MCDVQLCTDFDTSQLKKDRPGIIYNSSDILDNLYVIYIILRNMSHTITKHSLQWHYFHGTQRPPHTSVCERLALHPKHAYILTHPKHEYIHNLLDSQTKGTHREYLLTKERSTPSSILCVKHHTIMYKHVSTHSKDYKAGQQSFQTSVQVFNLCLEVLS